MLQDLGLFRRGFVVGSCLVTLTTLLVWTGVLLLQVLQAHRIPVQSTQLVPLETFPETGFVVVSRQCSLGPPFVDGALEPPPPPVFDFAVVAGFALGAAGESIVALQRPEPASVIWLQQHFTVGSYGRKGNFTCALTIGGFAQQERTQCFERAFADGVWYSDRGWYECQRKRAFDPIVGLSVGSWSTVAVATRQIQSHTQHLPSWPSETFFLLPTAARRLESVVERVDRTMREAIPKSSDYATALSVQEALSVAFPEGVWLFQAFNEDPLANIGPDVVRLRSSRCEGACEAGTSTQQISAKLEKAPPRWRQPLCNPEMFHLSEYELCVPITLIADGQEAVIISTVAFRWPSLFAQWLSPLVVFVLLVPVVLFAPCTAVQTQQAGSEAEGRGLIGGLSLAVGGSPAAKDASAASGRSLAQRVGASRMPQLDDEL